MILLHCRGKQRAAPHPWADMILLLGSTSIFQSILYIYSWLSVWGQKKNGLHTGTVQILFTLTRIKSKGKALKREEGKSGEEKLLRRWYKAHGSQATGAKEQGKIWYVVNRDCAAFFVLQLVNSTIQDYSWTVHPSFAPTWHFHCCSAISEGWSKLCSLRQPLDSSTQAVQAPGWLAEARTPGHKDAQHPVPLLTTETAAADTAPLLLLCCFHKTFCQISGSNSWFHSQHHGHLLQNTLKTSTPKKFCSAHCFATCLCQRIKYGAG